MPCLDADTIAGLFRGDLPDPERVELHVDECAACRRAIAAVARTRHADRDSGTTGPGELPSPTTTGTATRHVSLEPGDTVARYVITGFLGAGAMGAVYAARDPQLGRAVALKLVHAEGARGQRLIREAQAMARLSHPNVIPVFDAGETGELVFIAMKKVDGVSLRAHLASTTHPARDILRLMQEAGHGLAAAHAAGIVHRDLKPDNILVERDGVAQVGDFGLAAMREDLDDAAVDGAIATEWQTADGTILGTPAYMAPEVRRGLPADARSDQYSFAVTLAEAVTGARPGSADTAALPRRVRRVVARALADEPTRRYPAMDALLAELAPRRTPRAGAVALAAAAVTAAVMIGWPAPAATDVATACGRSASDRLGETWSPAVRAAIEAHVAALPGAGPAAIAATAVRRVDGYATAWLAMRQDACLATGARGEQTSQLRDLRFACLDERLDELAVARRALDQLAARDLDGAVRIADVLGDLSQCGDARGLIGRAGSGADAGATRALRGRLADARARAVLGGYDAAEHAADAVIDDARTARLPVIEAEALLVRSQVRGQARQPGVVDGFHDALAIGERLGDPAIRADALIGLIADATGDPARASEVMLLDRMIEAALAQLPGTQGLRRARLAGNLANHYVDVGDLDAAATTTRAAIAGFEAELGASHPFTIMARQNLARVLIHQGKYDEAMAGHAQILAAVRAAYGDAHPFVVRELLDQGVTLAQAQRRPEARTSFEQGVALAETVYGNDHVETADALRMLGYFLIDDDPAAARDVFRRAVTIFEHQAPDHPDLGPVLVGLGQAELEVGDPASAVTILQRGLAAWGDTRTNPHLLPSAHYALARALWKAGGDREHARALAIQARDEFVANKGPWLPRADEVTAWLDSHR